MPAEVPGPASVRWKLLGSALFRLGPAQSIVYEQMHRGESWHAVSAQSQRGCGAGLQQEDPVQLSPAGLSEGKEGAEGVNCWSWMSTIVVDSAGEGLSGWSAQRYLLHSSLKRKKFLLPDKKQREERTAEFCLCQCCARYPTYTVRTVGVLLLQDTLIHIRVKGKWKYLEKNLQVFFYWKLGNHHFKIQDTLYDPRGAIWYPTKHTHPEDSTRSAGDHWAAALRHCFTKCFNPLLFFRLRDPDQQILEDFSKTQIQLFHKYITQQIHCWAFDICICIKWHVVIKYKYLDCSTSSVTCRSIMLDMISQMQLYTSVGWQWCSVSMTTTMCCNIKLCCCYADLCTCPVFYSSALLCLALRLLSVHCWFFNTCLWVFDLSLSGSVPHPQCYKAACLYEADTSRSTWSSLH